MAQNWNNLIGDELTSCIQSCGVPPTLLPSLTQEPTQSERTEYEAKRTAHINCMKSCYNRRGSVTSSAPTNGSVPIKNSSGLIIGYKQGHEPINEATAQTGMSTNKKIMIGIGVLAVIGIGYYFLKVKN